MLRLHQVAIARGAKVVLAGVTASARAGDVVALVGPNGAGKSSLLAAAAGLLPLRSGTVAPSAGGGATGYLPQQVDYAFGPSVLDVVLLGRFAKSAGLGLASAHELALAQTALATCQASELAARRFGELSGGERQRVLFAQMLCQDAPIWLLDEPTSGLDPLHAHRLWSLMAAQALAGRTIVVATHDLTAARQFATQAWLVHDGAVRCGEVDDVLTSAAASAAYGVRFVLAEIEGRKHVVPVVGEAALP
ncbi:MAG: ABC transporter ATP-binding protein [Myxococcales bacterium]|nr:ABC transporter ATP-binding protein [Myxococcales bacterium]